MEKQVLLEAIAKNDIPTIEAFILTTKDDQRFVDLCGEVLCLAAKQGYVALVDLLKPYVDLKPLNNSLILAAGAGKLAVVENLLKEDDIDRLAINDLGWDFFLEAVRNNQLVIIKRFEQEIDPISIITGIALAVQQGNYKLAEHFIKIKPDFDKESILEVAIKHKDKKFIKHIIHKCKLDKALIKKILTWSIEAKQADLSILTCIPFMQRKLVNADILSDMLGVAVKENNIGMLRTILASIKRHQPIDSIKDKIKAAITVGLTNFCQQEIMAELLLTSKDPLITTYGDLFEYAKSLTTENLRKFINHLALIKDNESINQIFQAAIDNLYSYKEIIQTIWEKHAEVLTQYSINLAFAVAAEKNHKDILTMLVTKTEQKIIDEAFIEAVRHNNNAAVNSILSVNSANNFSALKDKENTSIFVIAVKSGNAFVTEGLLKPPLEIAADELQAALDVIKTGIPNQDRIADLISQRYPDAIKLEPKAQELTTPKAQELTTPKAQELTTPKAQELVMSNLAKLLPKIPNESISEEQRKQIEEIFILAVSSGYNEVVRTILSRPNIINDINNLRQNGVPIFVVAVSQNHLNTAKILLASDLTLNEYNIKRAFNTNNFIRNQEIRELIEKKYSGIIQGDLRQGYLLQQIKSYIEHNPEKYSAEFAHRFPGEGHCNGLSLLWAFSKCLQFKTKYPEESEKPNKNMDDYEWFLSTFKAIIDYVSEKDTHEPQLNDIDRFISLIDLFQLPTDFATITKQNLSQLDADKFMEDTTQNSHDGFHHPESDLAASFTFTGDAKALKTLLCEPNKIPNDKMILIHTSRHAVSVFKHEDVYFYFDSNNRSGEIAIKSIDDLTDLILTAADANSGKGLVFSVFSMRNTPEELFQELDTAIKKLPNDNIIQHLKESANKLLTSKNNCTTKTAADDFVEQAKQAIDRITIILKQYDELNNIKHNQVFTPNAADLEKIESIFGELKINGGIFDRNIKKITTLIGKNSPEIKTKISVELDVIIQELNELEIAFGEYELITGVYGPVINDLFTRFKDYADFIKDQVYTHLKTMTFDNEKNCAYLVCMMQNLMTANGIKELSKPAILNRLKDALQQNNKQTTIEAILADQATHDPEIDYYIAMLKKKSPDNQAKAKVFDSTTPEFIALQALCQNIANVSSLDKRY